MSKRLSIEVKTINGEILEFPARIDVVASQMIPIGADVVRGYNPDYCIVVQKVFLFLVGLDLFGTNEFSTFEGFYQFRDGRCYFMDGDCYLTINGIRITNDVMC